MTSDANDTSDVDVLVVGAGPTGLALAAFLAADGVPFRIIDRQSDAVHESRALAIQPRTLEMLAGLGVSDTLLGLGNRAVRLQMHVQRRVIGVPLFDLGLDDTAYPFLLFVSQEATERVLGDHLAAAGVRLERGVELAGLAQDSDVVSCRLVHRGGHEEMVRARYVVGCDGAHSMVRRGSGIAFEGSSYPQTFVLADLEADGIQPGAAHVFISADGMLFFFPLGHPATWRMLAMRPRADTTPVTDPVTMPEVQELSDAHTGALVRLRDPVWMTNFRLANRGAAHYRADRVFLAGDAAHIHSPAGAQGMNTGIQDAANLAWKLALVTGGPGPLTVLDSYEAERAPVGRAVLRFTNRAFTIATASSPVLRFVRGQLVPRVLPLALRFTTGRAVAFRTVSQLGIRYRSSPLCVDGAGAPRRGPRAGDRLPDGPVTVEGRRSTIQRSVAAPGFHLLLCGPLAAWPDDATAALSERYRRHITVHRLSRDVGPRVLHDPSGLVLRRLGLTGTRSAHLLVRPDGYLGYRGGIDVTGLGAHLAAEYGLVGIGYLSAP
ncbi:FAD-dependent monooxygenase [Pengzhenrongella frigida]|uniref:Monooxygenase n=1 Tax=Pengzhenrongella frigida TaxID=1259133 RepID=A0A4Q5MVW1_9MICO|nr:FAD-dependent monooxygenase [Cellulomonas sp. HLT2-17]RYV49680.1 monooxygenase [Cellulomonas sp. HLT2-17]